MGATAPFFIMQLVMNDKKLINRLADKQFEMIGVDKKLVDMFVGDDPLMIVTEKNKKVEWYKYYKFEDEEQYMKWRRWAKIEVAKLGEITTDRELEESINFIDLLYGLPYKIKKQ